MVKPWESPGFSRGGAVKMPNAELCGRIGYADLMRLAKDAGLGPENVSGLLQARLELFGRAVEREARAAEQERCARIAEGVERTEERHWVPGSLYNTLRRETAAEIRRKLHNAGNNAPPKAVGVD